MSEENLVTRPEIDEMKVRFEERISRIEGRVADDEKQIREMNTSITAIQRIEVKLETLQEDNRRIMSRLDEIEKEPADKWRKAVWYIVTALIGFILALIAKQFGV